MMTVELELASVIYTLYALDCVHWLKPGEIAVIRRFNRGWKSRLYSEASYTLLGRMPVLANPIDFRPSFLAASSNELEPIAQTIPDLIRRSMPDAVVLASFAWLGAINLLVFLPVLLITGSLSALWRIPLSVALFIQICIAVEFFEQGKAWRRTCSADFWQQFVSIMVNPLAALRSNDVLLRGYFNSGIIRPTSSVVSPKYANKVW
jgi:hypothetical protein